MGFTYLLTTSTFAELWRFVVMQLDLSDINLTPREVVERLDKHIVGQVNSLAVRPGLASYVEDAAWELSEPGTTEFSHVCVCSLMPSVL